MKSFVLILFLFATTVTFAQEETQVKGNSISSKEVPPTWPGCEGNIAAKETCFNQKLAQHIQQNFKFPKGYTAADKGSKVIVTFVINKEGKPEIKDVSGGRKILQDEAKRNILLLPEMKPGTLNGQPQPIQYKVPFRF